MVVIVVLGGWYMWSGKGGSYGYGDNYGSEYDDTYAPTTQTADGATQTTTTVTNTTTVTPAPAASGNLVLSVQSGSGVGNYLVASNGMALYTSTADSASKSNCSGSCAANWPPYTVAAGALLDVKAVVSGKVDTITRADGTMQVTYKGMPLYFWVGDKKAGDVTGNTVGTFVVAKP